MDPSDAIVNAIMSVKGPFVANLIDEDGNEVIPEFQVTYEGNRNVAELGLQQKLERAENMPESEKIKCKRTKYQKERKNIKQRDGLFYSEGCKNTRDPIMLTDFKTSDEVFQTSEGVCYKADEGYDAEMFGFHDVFTLNVLEKDCFKKETVEVGDRRLQKSGFDRDVPRGQEEWTVDRQTGAKRLKRGAYKGSVASRVRDSSKRQRFTSTEVDKFDKIDKSVMARLMKGIRVEFPPYSDDDDWDIALFPSRIKLSSDFFRLLPGIKSLDIEMTSGELKYSKFGKLRTHLEPVEYFSKLLGGYEKYLSDVTDPTDPVVESSLDVGDIREIDFLKKFNNVEAHFTYIFERDVVKDNIPVFFMKFLFFISIFQLIFHFGFIKVVTFSSRWCDNYDDN